MAINYLKLQYKLKLFTLHFSLFTYLICAPTALNVPLAVLITS